MKIIVDADACPTKDIIENVASKENIKLVFVCDNSHELTINYGEVIQVDKGSDKADYKVVSMIKKEDLVITQDYGLASLALVKGARVLLNSGFIVDSYNIESYLNYRYISSKARQAKIRTKNMPKRNLQDDNRFEKNLIKLIKEQ